MHKNKNTERTYVYENQMENSHIQSRGSPDHGSRIRISHAKRHAAIRSAQSAAAFTAFRGLSCRMDHAFSAHGNLRLPRDDETFRRAKEFRSPGGLLDSANRQFHLAADIFQPGNLGNCAGLADSSHCTCNLYDLSVSRYHARRRMAAGTLSALADLCGLSQCGHLAAELKK